MKAGKDLVALATEIQRQAAVKRDFIASTDAIRAVATVSPEAGSPHKVELTFGDQSLGINQLAHEQIGEYVGIPSRYYAKMLTEAPELLANNVNTWFEKYPEPRMIRTLDNRVRSMHSNKYRPLDNAELSEAILPVLLELGVEIVSSEITERRLYIKAVDKRVTKDIPVGHKIGDGSHVFFDTLSPGITIRNSEVGEGALSFDTSVFTRICTNLATIDRAGSLRKYHVGARMDIGEEVYKLLSDQTRRITDAALWAQARDVVKGAFEKARFDAFVDEKILGMTEQPITGKAVKVVELTAKKFGLNEGERESVLDKLIKGGDFTRYGLFNAVTRAAEDLPDYDRASDFEKLGGKIIELPANDWKALAEAA